MSLKSHLIATCFGLTIDEQLPKDGLVRPKHVAIKCDLMTL
jgi:hypothetical protein